MKFAKLLTFLLLTLIGTFIYRQADGQTTTNVAEMISRSYDYAHSGLYNEAKIPLIDALHNFVYINQKTPLRFALGQICFLSDRYDGAVYQWNKILEEDPNSDEAQNINMLYDVLGYALGKQEADIFFIKEYSLSALLWDKVEPDPRIDLKKLIDPILALEYLQHLSKRYPNGIKRAILLYDQFLLLMGYNDNDFGYLNTSPTSPSDPSETAKKYYKAAGFTHKPTADNVKAYFWTSAKAIADSMNTIDGGGRYYVRAQFQLAVSQCGYKLFSNDIKIVPEAWPYLQKVVDATRGDETNLYRIFAIKWLAGLEKKN
jgi:tetratricopeptide (TPR) repeat protein